MTVNSLANFGVPGLNGDRSAQLQPILSNRFRVLFFNFGTPFFLFCVTAGSVPIIEATKERKFRNKKAPLLHRYHASLRTAQRCQLLIDTQSVISIGLIHKNASEREEQREK